MAEWHKDLSKNAIHLAVCNKVVADIVVAVGNKALVLDIAVGNKALVLDIAVDKKLAEKYSLVAKNTPAVGDNNNLEQYGPEC